ncbi:MAG: amidohydrolase family protein [Bacillota bacterium]
MIIDFHTHCFADHVAAKAVQALSGRSGVAPFLDGTAGCLAASMDKAGIDKSVVLPIATKPTQVSAINDWAVKLQENPEFIPFGTIHPAFGNWKAEIVRLARAGIRGIKFHPDYQDFFAGEPAMLPVYEEILSRGMVIVFHAGVDIGLPPPVHCPPDHLLFLAEKFPGGKIIAAHMGGFRLWREVEDKLLGVPVYLDTSYSLFELGNEKMKDLIMRHGVERILFGTDSPWAGQDAEMESLKAVGFSAEDWRRISGGNARVLLNL